MMRVLTALGLALVLAACGADGEPQPPAPKPVAGTGLRVSGTARVGVSVSRGDTLPLAAPEPRIAGF